MLASRRPPRRSAARIGKVRSRSRRSNDGGRNEEGKVVRAEVHRIAGEIALKSPEQDVAKAKPILIAHSLLRANSKQSPGNYARQ